jgi:hypothetical protein
VSPIQKCESCGGDLYHYAGCGVGEHGERLPFVTALPPVSPPPEDAHKLLLKILDWSIMASDGGFLYRPFYGEINKLIALRDALRRTDPPEPTKRAWKAALAALGEDNPGLTIMEDPSSIVHALRAAYAVDWGRASVSPTSEPRQHIEAVMIGVLRDAGYTAEKPIPPHLVALVRSFSEALADATLRSGVPPDTSEWNPEESRRIGRVAREAAGRWTDLISYPDVDALDEYVGMVLRRSGVPPDGAPPKERRASA